jgi:hypothetical protein
MIKELLHKPMLIGLIGDVNSAKSNTLYHIIETLRKDSEFTLYTYGLKTKLSFANEFFSLEELEQIQNSLIITDETFSLFDLDNKNKKKQIEMTLRLLNHNNNILILSILPENAKKFLASKFDMLIFKKVTIADFINGSMTKRVVQQYCGAERGNTILNIPIDKALIFDGKSYHTMDVPYLKEYDSKAKNEVIIKTKTNLFKKKSA